MIGFTSKYKYSYSMNSNFFKFPPPRDCNPVLRRHRVIPRLLELDEEPLSPLQPPLVRRVRARELVQGIS